LRRASPGAVVLDDATTAATSAAPRGRARFVGREHELAVLEGLRDAVARERRPRLVLAVGEAGIGKSRLVDEFLADLGDSRILRGRCLAYGEGIAYWALREILWSAAGIALDDTAGRAAAKLRGFVEEALGPAAPDGAGVAGALAITAGIALADNPLEDASPDAVAEAIELAWPRLLGALAAGGPLAVVIEDLHWAEAPLLEMVELLVARTDGPVLVVCTARPEFAEANPAWGVRSAGSQVSLEPLAEAEMRSLVGDLLPGEDAARRERAAAAAEGNPFFAEEIAAHLADDGDAAAIPASVRTLLAARIDGLPAPEKQVLQEAAVVGRVFWAEPDEALRALERRGLVVARTVSSLPGRTELTFRHALIREVAYVSIPRARRSRAHAEVGRWIEERAGDRREEFAEVLAHHYEAAATPADAALAWPDGSPEREEVRARAVAALLDAGSAAYNRLELRQTRRFAERALALAADDRERGRAVELRAHTHHAVLSGDDAFASYLEALALAEAGADRETIARLRREITLLCVRYGSALRAPGWQERANAIVARGLAEVDEHDATDETAALLLGRAVGLPRWGEDGMPDPLTARRDALRAVAIAERLDETPLLARATETLGWIVLGQGLCEAEAMGERLLDVVHRAPGRVEMNESLVVASMCFARAGRFDRARELAGEAGRQARRLGPHRALHAASASVNSLLPAGRFDELGEATHGVEADAEADTNAACGSVELALAGRALWLHESGDAAAAARPAGLVGGGPPSVRPSPDPYFCVELLRPVLGVLATRERLAALPPARDVTEAVHRLRAELQLHAVARDWDAVERLAAAARATAATACAPVLGSIAEWAGAMRLAAEGRAPEAAAAAAVATDALDAFGERYTAARLRADLVPLLDDAAFAEETAARLERMGARTSAAQVRGR
ncbi:MAG TPA: AAA family ATPase, partial [Solirubrobacteraceae bacterium]|nr:AAA family ATPase [Solirubrobacteraceae bacterium]